MFVVPDGKNAVRIRRILADDDGDDSIEFLGAARVNSS